MAAWRWDRVHRARSEAPPVQQGARAGKGFELRAPVGGDTYTVNVSRVNLKPDLTTGELYLDEHGPSLRALYDLGDLANSRFMHSTGQSGIALSPHYHCSFVERWTKVDYAPLWSAPARSDAAAPAREVTHTCPNRALRCAVYVHHGAAGAPRMKSVAAMKVSSTHGSWRWPVAAHSFW